MSNPKDNMKKRLSDADVLTTTKKICGIIQDNIDKWLKEESRKPVASPLEIYVKLEKYNREILKLRLSIEARFPDGNTPTDPDDFLLSAWKTCDKLGREYISAKQGDYWKRFK